MKIAVIGAGGWGTTLANLLADKGYKVNLWAFEKEAVKTSPTTTTARDVRDIVIPVLNAL